MAEEYKFHDFDVEKYLTVLNESSGYAALKKSVESEFLEWLGQTFIDAKFHGLIVCLEALQTAIGSKREPHLLGRYLPNSDSAHFEDINRAAAAFDIKFTEPDTLFVRLRPFDYGTKFDIANPNVCSAIIEHTRSKWDSIRSYVQAELNKYGNLE